MGWSRVVNAAWAAGVTLVELLVVLLVSGVLLVIAVPAFSNVLLEARLRGAADGLQATLRQVHVESAKHGQSLSVSLSVAGGAWCYGVSDVGTCDCFSASACQVNGVARAVRSVEYQGVSLEPSVSGNRFSFQPKRMTMTSGSALFTAANGKQLRVVASGLGRIRVCSPAGDFFLRGYPAC